MKRWLLALLVAFVLGAASLYAVQMWSPWCTQRVDNAAWYPVVVSQFGVNPDGTPFRRDLFKVPASSERTHTEWCVNPR
jgi:hypothetical protein